MTAQTDRGLTPDGPQNGTAAAAPVGLRVVEPTRAQPEQSSAERRTQIERERTLAREAAAGDEAAQRALIPLVMPTVRAIARAFTSTTADADDAVQIALIEILRAGGGYRADALLTTWARRIAVRVIARHVRNIRRTTTELIDESAIASPESAMRASSMGESLPRPIETYLRALPPDQRDALVMHHCFGYELREIADILEISANTVKSRLRLGTKTIRKLFHRDLTIASVTQREKKS